MKLKQKIRYGVGTFFVLFCLAYGVTRMIVITPLSPLGEIDQIYVINLDRTPQRYTQFKKRFKPTSLSHVRFQAVEGYDLTLQNQVNQRTVKAKDLPNRHKDLPEGDYKIQCPGAAFTYAYRPEAFHDWGFLTAGEFGVACSHRKIWNEVVQRNYNAVVIFEDDVDFVEDFQDHLVAYTQSVPTDWDIIYIGLKPTRKKLMPIFYNRYLQRIRGGVIGSHAYIISHKGAKKLLKLTDRCQRPIDCELDKLAANKEINAYKTNSDLAFQKDPVSTINQMGRDH